MTTYELIVICSQSLNMAINFKCVFFLFLLFLFFQQIENLRILQQLYMARPNGFVIFFTDDPISSSPVSSWSLLRFLDSNLKTNARTVSGASGIQFVLTIYTNARKHSSQTQLETAHSHVFKYSASQVRVKIKVPRWNVFYWVIFWYRVEKKFEHIPSILMRLLTYI